MAILTPQIISELGIQLDESHYTLLSEHFDTTLQNRIIDEIIDTLSIEQAEQLASLQATTATDEEIYNWLVANVPQLAQIAADEVDILLGELAEDSSKF